MKFLLNLEEESDPALGQAKAMSQGGTWRRSMVWVSGVLFTLAGCGGGGPGANNAQTTDTVASVQISGHVIDGPLEGARVFLDLNGNLTHDEGEPISGLTDAQGAFTISTQGLSASQLATAMLVSDIPSTAKDADDAGKTLAEAGKASFTLLSPAHAFLEATADTPNVSRTAVVSPLTTLVASEILHNGLKLDEAREAVKTTHGLTRDPIENFIEKKDVATANVARAAAVAMGEAKRAASEAQANAGDMAKREQLQTIVQTVRDALPEVIQSLNLQSPQTLAPSVAAIKSKVEQSVTTKVKDRVALESTGEPAALGSPGGAPEFHDYVVVFKNTVAQADEETQTLMRGRNGTVRFTYGRALKGFAVRLPAAASEAFLTAMANHPKVDYVEIDAPVRTRQTVQSPATWGLDRIDQRDLPLSGSYSHNQSGNGVRAYVIDTGILASHVEFGGRVVAGYSAVADGNGTTDCNGHGTHVAGTIGGSVYGVAKSVTLVPVRVLDCTGSGSLSGVIAGIEWVMADPLRTPASVINLSLGAGASTSLDTAVANAVAQGTTVVAAAGNDNANACNYSPAREPSAITVGASTSVDARATFSNFGSCLDVFAPGAAITSAWHTSSTATNRLDGTSMAAPHVAGWVALWLASQPQAVPTPAQVVEQLKSAATLNKVTNAGSGSANLLLYTLSSGSEGGSGGSTPPEPTPSTAVAVTSLVGSASTLKNGWRASVTILISNSSGQPVSGASVTGGFTSGGSVVTCTTASNGTCSVKTGTLGKNLGQTTYTVGKVTGTNLSHDPNQNTLSSVTIRKP